MVALLLTASPISDTLHARKGNMSRSPIMCPPITPLPSPHACMHTHTHNTLTQHTTHTTHTCRECAPSLHDIRVGGKEVQPGHQRGAVDVIGGRLIEVNEVSRTC